MTIRQTCRLLFKKIIFPDFFFFAAAVQTEDNSVLDDVSEFPYIADLLRRDPVVQVCRVRSIDPWGCVLQGPGEMWHK